MRKQHSHVVVLMGIIFLATVYGIAQEPTRTIEVHAKRFSFVPSDITLKKGETVKLALISDDVPHSIVISDLHVKEEASKGHPAEVTITAEKAGDFHGKCGRFCGSGHGSMTFTVHVKDN